ncbi:MAG TPA: hypothetical protein PLJ47_02085, partial [Candidatus Hydrogenedentes bacterium]|nr:hypothetical protein [Candidatus Hydrogenedentota bacterium]
MRIILSMVAISLGIAIAIVAGVYGWQRYSAAPIPVAATPAPAPPPASAPEAKPAEPVAEAPTPVSVTPTTSPKPEPVVPALPAPKQPAMPTTAAPPTFAGAGAQPLPSAMPNAASESDVENQPIAVAEAPALATPEKLESLEIGMTEGDVIQVMGSEGVETPADQLPQFTPIGWYEVRWANADGSYIAAHFNQERTLRYVQPFNMPGAYAWLESPHYAVPAWLNDLL